MVFALSPAFQADAFQRNAFQIDDSFGGFSGANPSMFTRFADKDAYNRWRKKRYKKLVNAVKQVPELNEKAKFRVDRILNEYRIDKNADWNILGLYNLKITDLIENEGLFFDLLKSATEDKKNRELQKLISLIEENNRAIITMLLMDDE